MGPNVDRLSSKIPSSCCAGVPTAAAAQDVEAPDSPRKPPPMQPTVLVVQPNGYDVACGCARPCTRCLLFQRATVVQRISSQPKLLEVGSIL